MAKRIYAAVWTWKNHKVLPRKADWPTESRAWKERYTGLGWKITSLGSTGYMAVSPSGERHGIALHTYDAVTRERLD